jgi:hypothetical protein
MIKMTDINIKDFIKKLEEINDQFYPIVYDETDKDNHFSEFLILFEGKFKDKEFACILPVFFDLEHWNDWSYSKYDFVDCLLSVDLEKMKKISTLQSKLGDALKSHFSKAVVDDQGKYRKNILIKLKKNKKALFLEYKKELFYHEFTFPKVLHEKIIKKFDLEYTINDKLKSEKLGKYEGITEEDIKKFNESINGIKLAIKDPNLLMNNENLFAEKIQNSIITHSLYINENYSLLYIFSHTVSGIKKNNSDPYNGGLGGVFILINNKIIKSKKFKEIVSLLEDISDKLSIRIINYFQQKELFKQYLKIAIISILIDSYAHNISAHSLSALKWWFELRNNMMNKRFWVGNNGLSLACFQPCVVNITEENLETAFKNYTTLNFTDSIGKNSFSLYDFIQIAEIETVKNLFQFKTPVQLREFDNENKFNPRFPVPIDNAIFPFFKFLRDKGAFWSGVTRNTAFGGESKTWYRVLWEDFANNPLYLGTIAKSEGISKLNINLKIKTKDGHYIQGRFVTIDMSVIDYEERISQNPNLEDNLKNELLKVEDDFGNICKVIENPLEQNADPSTLTKLNNLCEKSRNNSLKSEKYSKYSFIRLGKGFECFRTLLDEEKFRVFLPGGVVGEHALFTIFENTIRNIKHYKDQNTLENIRANGINFWISIEAESLKKTTANNENDTPKPELFKVGIWLAHNVDLIKEKEAEKYFLFKITTQSFEPILEKTTGVPKMGGNSQDKACAAFLFNNQFSTVEDQKTDRDKEYFPWVRYATEINGNEFELIKKDNTPDVEIEQLKGKYKNKFLCSGKEGFLKKYFYLWRGEDVFPLKKISDFKSENVSRFSFVTIEPTYFSDDKEELKLEARKNGVIRVLEMNLEDKKKELNDKPEGEFNNSLINELYQEWLKIWVGENKKLLIELKDGDPEGTIIARIIFDDSKVSFKSDFCDSDDYSSFKNRLSIPLSHGSIEQEKSCNVRSHGSFWSKFFSDVEIKDVKYLNSKDQINPYKYDISKEHLLNELFETFSTQIILFDNRMYERFNKLTEAKKEMFKNYLRINVQQENKEENFPDKIKTIIDTEENYSEDTKTMTIIDTKDFPTILIMHLSFIESMGYTEKVIDKFINENISEFFDRKNFIFVITTGRGRDLWRTELEKNKKENYKILKKTLFKPIESLLNAVESGISYNDNFDVKYNLMKVILGS